MKLRNVSALLRSRRAFVAAEQVVACRHVHAGGWKGTRRGFTLIELVTVIVILGILASVAIPVYLDYSDDAKQSADETSIAAIRTALELIYVKHRIDEAPNGEWITWVGMIKNAMHGGELPEGIESGITMGGYKLRDSRGNTYSFTPETASTPAKLSEDPPGAPGFS